jgi:hypothetical protein
MGHVMINMNKSSQTIYTFKSYQRACKSLIRFIIDGIQEWMQILLKFITNKVLMLQLTISEQHVSNWKWINKLTYNLHNPSQNLEYNKTKGRS